MNLAVLGDRVLVKAISQAEHDTASGLYTVQDYAPETLGTVMACGEGLDFKKDDVVVFPPSAGRDVEYEGERYLIMDADEILAIWE